jgi:hypothetical protein
MGSSLATDARDDSSSCIEKRRRDAAIARVAGLELASKFRIPGTSVLGWRGGRHEKRGGAVAGWEVRWGVEGTGWVDGAARVYDDACFFVAQDL